MAACNIKFMTNNLIPGASFYDFSSEQSLYPFANALHSNRGKYWLPNGNFEIVTDSNDKVYVKGTINQTVTLDSGTYTAATLATEIQTKLNGPSTNWVCTYSTTTRKFTINRTVGIANLRLSQQTNAVWDTIGFTGTTDRLTPPFLADEPRIHTSEWVTIDIGLATEVTFLGLIGPITEAFGLSTSATVTLSGNNVNVWTAPPFQQTITTTERGILYHLDADTDTYYRYWRLEIVDNLNPAGSDGLKFGYLYIGGAIQPTSSNIQRGFGRSEVDPSKEVASESGHLYFDTRPQYNQISGGSIAVVSAADRLEIEQIGHDFGKHVPLFVALDPLEEVSADPSELTYYMYFSNVPKYSHLFLDYYSISLDMKEAV